jgi:hypothetical protein
MITLEQVRKIALSLENVEESTSYGTPAFKSGGRLLVRVKEDGDSLVMVTTFEEREEMLREDPDTYYITDHYLNYPLVLVRMSRVSADAMRDLLTRALRLVLTKNQKPATRNRSLSHVASRRKPR